MVTCLHCGIIQDEIKEYPHAGEGQHSQWLEPWVLEHSITKHFVLDTNAPLFCYAVDLLVKIL